jgi:uncharacterized protein
MKLAMVRYKRIVFFSKLLILFSFNLVGQNYPSKPEPAVYVNDLANIFQDQQRLELETMLVDYYDSTSTQIVVVTINSLEGMDASQYATELGEKWGVGKASKDNGVLFLVAPQDRKMFIATGRGTEEKLTDVFLGRIRDNYILPEFKSGNYYAGVRQGVLQIINRLSGTFESDEESVSQGGEISIKVLLLIILIMFLVFWFLAKLSKAINYGETYSGKGYRDGWGGGGFWGGGGSSWGGGSSGGSFGGGSFGGGSFGGGGAGGSW